MRTSIYDSRLNLETSAMTTSDKLINMAGTIGVSRTPFTVIVLDDHTLVSQRHCMSSISTLIGVAIMLLPV